MITVGDLPLNWCDAKIAEITYVNPTIDKAGIPDDLAVSFVPMSAVQAETGIIDVSDSRKFSEVKKGYTPFREGDVLFAKITPCMENGKLAVVPEVRNGVAFGSTEFHVLRVLSGVNAKYVYYYVSTQVFRREAEHNMSGAVGQRRVTTPYLASCGIPLPSTNEQQRIVAKIEELFSELDKGIENLKTARAQLKVYRQALLKHAFEGKLTAKWRAENPDKLETAAALLKRIQSERAERYQQQLAEWEKSKSPSIPLLQRGKSTSAATPSPSTPTNTSPSSIPIPPFEKGGLGGISKPKAPKPLPPLTAEELAELPALPEGWGWVPVSHLLSEELCNGKSVKDRTGGFPVLRLNALGEGRIDLSVTKAGDWSEAEALNYIVQNDDFLVSRGNGSKHLVGRGGFAHYKSERALPVAFPDTMIRIRLLSGVLNMLYFGFCWDSLLLRKQIEKSARTTAGIYKINQEIIEAFVLPLPCLDEQCLIADMLSEKLSETDQLDQTITTALQQAEALRQSILKKAFSGQLVPQDPHDEPASALLARIKAEKEKSPQPPFGKGGRARSGGGISTVTTRTTKRNSA